VKGGLQMDKGTYRTSRKRNGKQAKEAAKNKNIEECYMKIPKSVVISELKEQSVKWWQREWKETTKGATKTFFPKIEYRLKLRINATPKFITIVTGHGNKNLFTQIQNTQPNDPTCPCRKGQQTVQHIIFDCPLVQKEREKLKAVVKRSQNWPVSCNKLAVQYHRIFKEYIDNISWNED
jgi:hypothetical protein